MKIQQTLSAGGFAHKLITWYYIYYVAVEIEGYSVAYFDRIALFEALYH